MVVKKIEIEGLQRVSIGSALNLILVEQGDDVSQGQIGEAIKRLYQSGLFRDIKAYTDAESGLLQFQIVEQPSISVLDFNGNKAVSTDILKQVFRDAKIQEGEVFNRSNLDQLSYELERQYAALGRYNAKVEAVVTPLPRNRVKVELEIDEGRVARVASIDITGNSVFSDQELIKAMNMQPTRSGDVLQMITRNNRYSSETARSDQEALTAYYLDRGYIRFELTSTQVAISLDRRNVHLTYNLREGVPYTVSNVQLTGELVGDDQKLRDLVTIKSGELFSRQKVSDVQKALQDRLTDLGYAFAQINTVPDIDDEKRLVDLTIVIEPGKRTYVRKVNVTGNESTNDEVIRRELTQMEGALVSGKNIQTSKSRLERTGYFKTVEVSTSKVQNTDDQVDLNINVAEASDGIIKGSIGYADPGGIFYSLEYTQKNFRGSGRDISIVGSQTANYEKSLELTYTNPYFTLDGVSLEYNAFLSEEDYSEISENDYGTNNWGGGFTFGYPISNDDRLSYGIGYTNTNLYVNEPPLEIQEFIDDYGKKEGAHYAFEEVNLNLAWTRSTLNGTTFANKGQYHRVSVQASMPFSDLEYYKITYEGKYYQPISDGYFLKFRSKLGYGSGYGDSTLPFLKNYYAGGISTLRGFSYGGLGPYSTPSTNDDPSRIGGNILLNYGVDFYFPMPLVEDKSQFRSSFFIDAGNVFTDHCLSQNADCTEGVVWDDIRYSYGIEFDWMTPIAPLRFIWGWPVDRRKDDEIQTFAFTIGYNF
ncbi:outer membrane protein assembly factor BamA [Gynuella sunshinyii]|uniref:Outer membrane protein assembly factor BamA n=1 Tax=Gynuella sunshinyii YC6258 TaxID=1445510 RepID=A0A0C5VK77_9GAMM|nr:outer membrane protein assembly factor BamA [Gynuella sunshinyii]AJQ94681.1 outer membrane protein/protective antigen OMA87 [Gynuella sunshinyii YC6258]